MQIEEVIIINWDTNEEQILYKVGNKFFSMHQSAETYINSHVSKEDFQ